MLEHKVSTDFIFVLGESRKEIPCHQFILTTRSGLFQAMLENPILERNETGTPVYHVEDVNDEDFNALVRFLYTDDIQLTGDNVMTFLHLSRTFMVKSLSGICKDFITAASLEEHSNAVDIYYHAYLLDLKDIMEDMMKIINQKTKECLRSEAFLSLPVSCVESIISSDSLQVDEEIVYKYALKWAERECERKNIVVSDANLRHALGPLLKEIRFPILSEHYFQSKVYRRAILTDDEKKDLMLFRANKKAKNYRGPFKTRKRTARQQIVRFETFEESPIFDQVEHTIAFSVDTPCSLHGVITFGSSRGSQNFDVLVGIKEKISGDITQDEFTLRPVKDQKMYPVYFQKAIDIEVDKVYVIRVSFTEINWMWDGRYGLSTVPFKDGEVRFLYEEATEETNVFQGQIAGIILS